jgi:hypothetical protein
MKWPPDDPQRHNEQAMLKLFKLVREFLELEGLTHQCADFVQARICGYPYEPMQKREPGEPAN